MNVTLEELRDEWAQRTRHLDERLGFAVNVLQDDWMERNRERIRKSGAFGPFEMIVWVATLVLLGHFLATHFAQPALFATALVLDAWVIAMGAVALRQQHALRSLDYGRPVVELQADVEAIRIARIRTFNWGFLTGQIVWWIPFAVVTFAALTGVNLYDFPKFVAFAAWNLAFGVAVIPLAIWVARRYGNRLSKVKAIRYIADSIAGRDIAAAREYLQKLHRFDSEAS
ncbi:MAG TPA: hypothetical protein VGI57_06100 [Usitatibacter sp.]